MAKTSNPIPVLTEITNDNGSFWLDVSTITWLSKRICPDTNERLDVGVMIGIRGSSHLDCENTCIADVLRGMDEARVAQLEAS